MLILLTNHRPILLSTTTKVQIFLPFSGKQGIQLLSKIKKTAKEKRFPKRENIHYIRRHKTFTTVSFER